MSLSKIRFVASFLLVGSFFILDRILKHLSFTYPDTTHSLIPSVFGWEYFENTGVAFGIPIPWFFAFVYTPIFLVLLWWYYKKHLTDQPYAMLGLLSFLFGSISNLLDRILHHFTIDYIRIFTAVINIADIMIVLGALLLFFVSKQSTASPQNT